jgi:AraC-like DNA-binding protein
MWEAEFGALPLQYFVSTGDNRMRVRGAKVHDVAIVDLHGVRAARGAGIPRAVEDQVRMYAMRRGTLSLGEPPDRDERIVPAGRFLLRKFRSPPTFETTSRTSAKILVLPSEVLAPLLGNRTVAGSANSAEMRLLLAHSTVVRATAPDLGPAGVRAARDTLLELVKAVVLRRFDDTEPLLASALAQAAKDLADSRLTDPELSTAMLARELNVSVRTLQRAFAATGEPVTAYVRRRRLEEARLALSAPAGPPGLSELAARWQFADSSHFIRTFKKHYGQTPTEYARSNERRPGDRQELPGRA